MSQNGQFVKRGVLTSRDMLESTLQTGGNNVTPIITEVRREVISNNNIATLSGKPNIVINRAPNLTTEELNETKYFNSLGIHNGRPDYQFNYAPNVVHSNFVPPPPSKFLVSSGHHQSSGSQPSQPSQLPIQSNHLQTVQTIQPLYQSVRKTYIPHHIYNEIPIMNSETKYYVETQHQQQESREEVVEEANEDMNDHDQELLDQYEKVYEKYMQELAKSENYERRIEALQNQLNRNERQERSEMHQPEIREVIHTKQVYISKPTRIDTKQLVSILMKKFKPILDDTFERKKSSCLNKLRMLFNDQQSIIKTAVIRSSQELTIRLKNH